MTDIHPLPPEEKPTLKISPVKGAIFGVIILGIVIFGVFAQTVKNTPLATDVAEVLGEDTSAQEATASSSLSEMLNLGEKVKPESVYLTGKEFLASATSELASQAAVQTEKVASEAAKNVTEFVYKNTIERIINSLIESLPEERQKQYNQ